MTSADERVAAEMGRLLLALYRAGLQVKIVPDALNARAEAVLQAAPGARLRSAALPRSTRATGDSPLSAICAAVERLNERAGAIVVALD